MSELDCIEYTKQMQDEDYVVVSINTYGNGELLTAAPLNCLNKHLLDVLSVFFDDIEERHIQSGSKNKLCSKEDISNIIEFVEKWRNKVSTIIVHCHAGISRSSAIASIISIYLGLDDYWIWSGPYIPNRYIFKLACEFLSLPESTYTKRFLINDEKHDDDNYLEIEDISPDHLLSIILK